MPVIIDKYIYFNQEGKVKSGTYICDGIFKHYDVVFYAYEVYVAVETLVYKPDDKHYPEQLYELIFPNALILECKNMTKKQISDIKCTENYETVKNITSQYPEDKLKELRRFAKFLRV
jgi:hypothetical protein